MNSLRLLGVNSQVIKVPSSQQHFLDFVNINMSPVPSFFFQPITYDCVKTGILSLANDKSHGLYSSPTKLLKCSIDIIAPVLFGTILYFYQLSQGDILKNWNCPKLCLFLNPMMRRTQIIIDLHLYCQTSTKYLKGLCIYNRMVNYNEKHNFIYFFQYGFREGHFTQHAI